MDVSIVIPVKNGGELLGRVLEAVKNQKTVYEYEIIVVDSGSKDNSVSLAKEMGAKVYEIAPEEFGHGKTRNLGASYGSGRYIVFLTQDALPYDCSWLNSMVEAMDESGAAGGFGKHLPYPDCNMVDQKLLHYHFLRFGEDNGQYYEFQLNDDNKVRYTTDSDYEQLITFFSDNCSILRRTVWQEIPYEDVDFAEDQIWAKTILEAGYKKIYIPSAKVYHSHDYPLKEYSKRYFDDFKAVYKVHGYNMCPDELTFIKLWIRNSLSEFKYVFKRRDLGFSKKLYWCGYAIRRHYLRNDAARNAVKYFTLDAAGKELMDKKFSQQLTQRG